MFFIGALYISKSSNCKKELIELHLDKRPKTPYKVIAHIDSSPPSPSLKSIMQLMRLTGMH